MKNKFLKIIFGLALIIGAWFFLRFVIGGPEDDWICVENQWVKHGNPSFSMPTEGCGEQVKSKELPDANSEPEPIKEESQKNEQTQVPKKGIILLKVPFLAQAPFGQWEDPIYQSACEEAALLMAMLWVKGEAVISKEDATIELKKFADFEIEKYNNFYDHSAVDTAQLMRDYFNYNNVKVVNDISIDDIVGELEKGNVVIVPINGQVLMNPYYTPPGPAEHMLLIKGYDYNTKEFITNDVGTRQGENFRYDEDILWESIRDYPTGHKEPILEIKKTTIVVWR